MTIWERAITCPIIAKEVCGNNGCRVKKIRPYKNIATPHGIISVNNATIEEKRLSAT